MAKIIKRLSVSWKWTGDKYSLLGFNIAVTPTTKTPLEEVVATAFVETNELQSTYTYAMDNVTLDKDGQYKVWVQAVYENSDSDWVATGGATVTDDGNATIIVKNDREIQDIINMASDSILTRQEKINLRREWQEIVYEFLQLETTALNTVGIPSTNAVYVDYKAKANAIGAYINGGTAWTITSANKDTFPSWINNTNLGNNTAIVGDTFRAKFRDYYTAKVKIEDEIKNFSVNSVQDALNNFQTTVEGTFKDGIIEEAEAKAIAQNLNTLDSEKSDIDKEYTSVYGNVYLTGTAKSNLNSAKTAFNNAHTSLKSTINTVIADGKVTTTEKNSVNSTFATYNTVLGTYKQRLQEALDFISTAKVDGVQIGGENILLRSGDYNDSHWYSKGTLTVTDETYLGSKVYKTNKTWAGKAYRGGTLDLDANQDYTYSFYAKKDENATATGDVFVYGLTTGGGILKINNIGTSWKRYSITVKGSQIYDTVENPLRIGLTTDVTDGYVLVCGIKLEKGNKATDWSPATEDMENAYTVVLSNESQVIPTSSSRVPTASTTYYTDVQVYQGTAPRTDYTIGNLSNANGITVSKTASRVNFAVSTGTTLTSDGGLFTIPITIDGKTFNKVFSWSCSKQGQQGQQGASGASGISITSADVEYYLSTSSTTQTGGSWSTTAPTWANGKYMWSRIKTTYSNGTTSYSNPACITGQQGSTGNAGATGTGIASITEEYYLSTSKTAQSGGSWTTTPPVWSAGKYLWTRSKIVYTNPSSTVYTTPICDSSWEAVNEIEIGTVNQVKYSRTFKGFSQTGGGWHVITPTGNKYAQLTIDTQLTGWQEARTSLWTPVGSLPSTVTLSMEYYINVGSLLVVNIGAYGSGGTRLGEVDNIVLDTNASVVRQNLADGWKLAYVTIDVSSIQNIANTLEYKVQFKKNNGLTGKAEVRKVKVEFGNKVTSYSEATEDIQEEINNAVASVDVMYYLSTSQTSLSGGSWSTTAPAWVDGKYMWQKTVTTLKGGSVIESNPTCIAGASGADGKGIKSIVEQYYHSTSMTTMTGGSWSTTVPTPVSGKFIWTRSIITYTDNTSTTTSGVCSTGAQGQTGATGADAYTVLLSNESHAFPTQSNGNIPTAISTTTTVMAYKGATSVTPTYGTLPTVTGLNITRSGNVITIQAKTGTTLADSGTFNIPVIVDGKTFNKTFSWSKAKQGNTGATGSSGVNGYSVVLTNEAQVIPTDKDRRVTSAFSFYTDIQVYQGTTSKTFSVGTIANANNITVTKPSTSRVQFAIASGATVGAESGVFTIPVTVDGVVYNKVVSWSVSKQGNTGATGSQGATGQAGANAKSVDITASSQVFKSTDGGKTFSPDTIKLKPTLQNLTYSNWQYSTNGGTNWSAVSSGSNGCTIASGELTIAKTCSFFTNSVTSVVFRVNTNDSAFYDTMTVVKLYDVVELSQADIFNKLTNNGTAQGMFLENGQLYLNGTYIKASSITTDKLMVGDFNNLVQIHPDMNPSGIRAVVMGDGIKYFKSDAEAYGSIDLLTMHNLDFSAGDEYSFTYKGMKDATPIANATLIFRYFYTDGTWSDAGSKNMEISSSTPVIRTITLRIASAPTSRKALKLIKVFISKDNTTSGSFYLTDMKLYKKGSGGLIVNGSITADQITSGTFKGTNFVAGGSSSGDGHFSVLDESNATIYRADKAGIYAKNIIFATKSDYNPKTDGHYWADGYGFHGLSSFDDGTLSSWWHRTSSGVGGLRVEKIGAYENNAGIATVEAHQFKVSDQDNTVSTVVKSDLVSTSGSVVAQGAITSRARIYGASFNQSDYGLPNEIGRYIDMHQNNSSTDMDVRLEAIDRRGLAVRCGDDLSQGTEMGRINNNASFIKNMKGGQFLTMEDGGRLAYDGATVPHNWRQTFTPFLYSDTGNFAMSEQWGEAVYLGDVVWLRGRVRGTRGGNTGGVNIGGFPVSCVGGYPALDIAFFGGVDSKMAGFDIRAYFEGNQARTIFTYSDKATGGWHVLQCSQLITGTVDVSFSAIYRWR